MAATATITAQYVDAPKNGNAKAPWSVKDSNGARWKFWPDRAGRIDQGQTVTVEWKEGDEYRRTYKDITAIVNGGSPSPAPASNGHAAASRSAPQDDRTPERIFVCGILNAAISSQQLDPFDGARLTDAGMAAKEAYKNLFG